MIPDAIEICQTPVSFSRHLGLLELLAYARHHAHSRRWVPAIVTILSRKAVHHG
jgi:hypothetical protein